MSSGLYPDQILVERFASAPSVGTLAQRYPAPCDLDVIGMMLWLGTAPGTNDGITVNISNLPTSQQGGALSSVSAYNLWTATNVPTILGAGTESFTTTNALEVIENVPYALNYPLPGPTGTVGYETAQATSQITTAPVTAPPQMYKFSLNALVAPDNTYTDYNGFTAVPALSVHAGDVLSFVIAAAGTGASVGAAANLEILLYAQKR
jgi:hypothetical protein